MAAPQIIPVSTLGTKQSFYSTDPYDIQLPAVFVLRMFDAQVCAVSLDGHGCTWPYPPDLRTVLSFSHVLGACFLYSSIRMVGRVILLTREYIERPLLSGAMPRLLALGQTFFTSLIDDIAWVRKRLLSIVFLRTIRFLSSKS